MADMLWIMKIVLKKELHYGYILYEQRITLGKMHIVDFYLKKMKTMACPKNPVKYVKSDSIGPKFADMLCMNIVLVFSDSAICFFLIYGPKFLLRDAIIYFYINYDVLKNTVYLSM